MPVFTKTRTQTHTCSLGLTHSPEAIRPLVVSKPNAQTKQVQGKVFRRTNQEPTAKAITVKARDSTTMALAMISSNASTTRLRDTELLETIKTHHSQVKDLLETIKTHHSQVKDLLEPIKAHNLHKMLNLRKTLMIPWASWLKE